MPIRFDTPGIDMPETLDDTTYADVRGFNYQPSHASHGLEIWGTDFNRSLMQKELWIGKQHFPGMNTVRLWLSQDAYTRFPERVPERFGKVLDLGDTYDLEFIVTLFNGWHSYPDLGGLHPFSLGEWHEEAIEEVFEPYVDDIVRRFADHENVRLWDLCNEPSFSDADQTSHLESVDRTTLTYQFLERVYEQIRGYDPAAPTTVGTVGTPTTLEQYEPLSDVLSTHPYYTWNLEDGADSPAAYEGFLDDAVAFANDVGKPLLATETGWGAIDDEKRAEILSVELSGLAARDIGFTAHLLHHTLVADGHRPEYGPVFAPGNMAFVEPSGGLRPHHGVFNKF